MLRTLASCKTNMSLLDEFIPTSQCLATTKVYRAKLLHLKRDVQIEQVNARKQYVNQKKALQKKEQELVARSLKLEQVEKAVVELNRSLENQSRIAGLWFPGHYQRNHAERQKGWILNSAFASLLLLDIGAAYNYFHKKNAYIRTSMGYNRTRHQEAFERFKQAGQVGNGLLALTGSLYLYNYLDIRETPDAIFMTVSFSF